MKRFFNSRTIQAAIISAFVLVIIAVLNIWLQKPTNTTPLVSQRANSNSSSNIIQIANVNQEATYNWANMDSWKSTIKTCSEQHLTADCEYTAELQFSASTPIPPLGLCLNVKSNADIAGFSLYPYGEAKHILRLTQTKEYSFCMPRGGSLIGTGPTFKLEFYQKPETSLLLYQRTEG